MVRASAASPPGFVHLGSHGEDFSPRNMGFHGISWNIYGKYTEYIYDIMYIYIKYHTWNIIGTYMEHV